MANTETEATPVPMDLYNQQLRFEVGALFLDRLASSVRIQQLTEELAAKVRENQQLQFELMSATGRAHTQSDG